MHQLNLTPQIERFHILGSAQADHDLIFLSIENFRRLFTGARPPDANQQFADIQQLITTKIPEHFADEESRVFPLLFAGQPGKKESQVSAVLCQEHATLLAQANRLNVLLQRVNLPKCKGELWSAMHDFLSDLEKHVTKEVQLFEAFTCLVATGDTKHALQVADTISDDPLGNAQALGNIAAALATAGDTQHAQAFFTHALRVANALSNTITSVSGRPPFSHNDFHYAGTPRF